LASIAKEVVDWVDKQVEAGKFRDSSQFVEAAIADFKELVHDLKFLKFWTLI
jgi:Arc/MetJ-type ribon-helix-helix transcriptional regulator